MNQPHRYRSAIITTWEGGLPKTFDETEARTVMDFVLKHCKAMTPGSLFHIPRLPLNPRLQSALAMSHKGGKLVRGIPAIQHLLENEQTGLNKLAGKQASAAPRRISRIILVSNDASERFYNQVEELFLACEPRLAGILIDCTSDDLSRAIYGKPGDAKAVLASHRNSLNLILGALYPQTA